MANKHFKRTVCGYGGNELQTADEYDLDLFDDRTLSGLTGTCRPLCDGVDNDNPLKTLPLERWRDR